MTIGHQSGPTGERRAVNPGDYGFGEACSGSEEALVDDIDLLRIGRALNFGKVHACAEGFSVGGQQDGGDGRVGGSLVEGIDQGAVRDHLLAIEDHVRIVAPGAVTDTLQVITAKGI